MIPLKDITEILDGRITKVFDRFKVKREQDKHKIELSFSIISHKRSLDLEASHPIEKRLFIDKL